MVRTVTMKCLICSATETLDIDLPRDGEPISLVCERHIPSKPASGEVSDV
ncbi:hypothetical protein H9Y04_35175 [Streptomyces sp. TRM66268-LWL]|uniref:Uncharacterized protein n=1 Tax=Streptomyces polyasparticus TaxID=2767826 RepID=A0ABR7SQL2_9ACTN|nr:hypothetical protein [Streptomyces polyasparticus]MBC9717786.1 hypothetical protein [Streptomyces polyasparticus]